MKQKLPFSLAEREGLHVLKRVLHDSGFVDLLIAYGNEEDRSQAFRFDLPLLPAQLQVLVRLFCLGDELEKSAVSCILPIEVIDILQKLEIAHITSIENIHLGKLRIVYHFGVLILCERPDVFNRFYYNNDSLALGKFLRSVNGSLLDLCAGVGTQGLLGALTAHRLVAVETQQEVYTLFWANAVLNGLEEKVELRIGDFLQPIEGEQFDYICCNPPLLPVPVNTPFPLVGNGGEDGLFFTKRLLHQLRSLLLPGGRCYIVGTLLGDKEGPDLDLFQTFVEEYKLNLQLILPQRVPLSSGTPMFEAMIATSSTYGKMFSQTVRGNFMQLYEKQSADYLYFFLLGATLSGRTVSQQLTITQHYLRGSLPWAI